MKITYKYSAALVMSLALVNEWPCFQCPCRGAERTPGHPSERTREEGPGVLPVEQTQTLSSRIFGEASKAGLTVMSTSKITSRTNSSFIEMRQNLALEATEPQLLVFLENVAATNSPLCVQSFSLRPAPDRSRLNVNMVVSGDYRLPGAGQPSEPDTAQVEYRVVSQRRHLRETALDCYKLLTATLPSGWQLDSLKLQDGKTLSAQGQAPAEEIGLLEELRTRLEKSRGKNGNDLFSSGEATMRRVSGLTNFLWAMQFELKAPESR